MIAPGRPCGCYDKAAAQTFTNTIPLNSYNSIQNLEKCVCPKPNEAGYQRLKGTCDFCCKGNIKSENDCTEGDSVEEKKSKVFSEIVEKGLPYKETEVIINDNRMIIRVQKDAKTTKTNNEWDPPCDCNEENSNHLANQVQNKSQSWNDITFRKVDFNNSQNSCRTFTVYPQPDSDVHSEPNVDKSSNDVETTIKKPKGKSANPSEIERQRREASRKRMDLEENPNIFVLRIKKRCKNEEGKYNIDLEFRTPRPWSTKPIVEKPPPVSPIESKVSVAESENDKKEQGQKKKSKKGKKKKK